MGSKTKRGDTVASLTADQKALFAYVDGLIPGDGDLQYDFRDPQQYAFALMMARLGEMAGKYPGTLKTLELMKADHERNGLTLKDPDATAGWVDAFPITGIGLAQGPNRVVASNGITTVVGGYSSMNATLVVQNNQSGDFVAHGSNGDFDGKLMEVATDIIPGGSTDLNVTSYLSYSYTAAAGEVAEVGTPPAHGGVTKRVAHQAVTADPSLTAPCRTTTNPKNPKAVNIGLGRPWSDQGGNSQFDYAWNEPTQNKPIGKVPLVGSVVFSENIAPLEPETGFILTIRVADKSSGGTIRPTAAELNQVYTAFSIDATNPKKLVWALNPGASTSDPGNPIVFTAIPWPSDILAFFYCSIIVRTTGPMGLATAAIQSATEPDDDALDGIATIMPIDFIWHCIGGGAMVAMADGSQKPIEYLLAGQKVMGRDGAVEVVWTNKGTHKGSVFFIQTNEKNDVVVTDHHIFITSDGPKSAHQLAVGDALVTQDGAATVIRVARIEDHDGMMYNLATRDYQDPGQHDGEIATFFANGLLVGDVNAQQALVHVRRNDIEYIRSRVPTYLHPDVETFFAEKHM